MKTSFTTKQLSLAVACALTMGFTSGAARAQALAPVNERALVTDASSSVVKNGYGECWHNAFGPAPLSAECDPNYKLPVAQLVVPAPKPAPVVAPPPAPRPAVVAVVAAPPSPIVTKVTLDADALFDFDKAVLRPEGRTALDGFVAKMGGVELETIMAIGHTDRIGSDSYNQALSEKRADAVKAYLIAKGVQPDRVHTEGMGEKQPVTKSDECPGAKSAKVISCLQPDRRVEVEVIGTRTTR